MLSPTVMSWKQAGQAAAVWYSHGFRKPSGLPVFLITAAFRIDTTAANSGEEHEVPPTGCTPP
jgi:hypothetical protein